MPLPERSLIAQLRSGARKLTKSQRESSLISGVIEGIGDDCAVLRIPSRFDSLVTTDFTLEGVHFRREWHTAESVGHRCLTRGLSDIAAMGGEPVAAFLSLALPADVPQSWVTGFIRGLLRLAKECGVTLAGGDTAQSPGGILGDIMVIGAVPKGKAILRSGARRGDRIYVSGAVGGSAAAVVEMMSKRGKAATPRTYPRHFYPQARLELARILRERGIASAMIDTSDGLSTDLSHICQESRVGAEIDSWRIPRAHVGKPAHEVELELALHGGEDYELLFTVPARKRVPAELAGVRLTEIGRITGGSKMLLHHENGRVIELKARGWEHFRR